ncbi:MAG: phenylpyruvate tautomerase MIF-related protein [Bacillota bacterium]|nr:phenylpyruvate tautomerase MIF-related protein [Bacillota bacterium]
MPYIGTKVTTKITKEQETELKNRFGSAITLLPGKSEAHLMLCFEDDCRMYFASKNNKPIAYVEVKIFGKSTADAYSALTARICSDITEVLGIDGDHTYVKYEEIDNWGMNGFNF